VGEEKTVDMDVDEEETAGKDDYRTVYVLPTLIHQR